ncbi:methyltetrahydrofolate cobalamin methyltransferase [Tepidanaerobacter acetatoxydans]|uniref:methyltetrahydrofolate cobalamin methyltransferase n=1 Tax=Tepidanaerobacter acetatoxydans TaxID=499229 RepID=UPI001BD2EEBB|nr:methyltetrahydrofolate cobalamin methyltransferase [Tepidanaerobacter acetatoxydans]
MIIIGEKINGTIPSVKKAIEEKDEKIIHDLAVRQADAGADYIDVCAGTTPEIEVETLKWLMNIVQDATDKPLCIDSPNPRTIETVFGYAQKPGIINSVSLEGDKCEVIYPLIQGTDWQVIALTCDNKGIPSDVKTRIGITDGLVEKAEKYKITPDRIHIDPLVIALATDNQSLLKFIETMKIIKEKYNNIKITSGLSNISFGMPLRRVINQTFLTLAIYAGMDSAIMDPCNRDMMATLLATEALLGRDRYCRKFTNAYRKGKIGPKKD